MSRKSRKTRIMLTVSKAKFTVAGYLRLSVVKEKYPSESIDNQAKMIDEFISYEDDMELYTFYVDENATGTDFNRPAFKEIIDDISSGKVNCVIVKDLLRLGRDFVSVGYYIQQYFPSKNVRFISLNDNFDTLNGITNIDDPIRPISKIPVTALVDEYYAKDISNKVQATIDENIRSGKFVAPRAPYGYKKSDDDCHKLVPDSEAEQVVKEIFNMAYNNKGLTEIVRILNSKGYPTPILYAISNGLRGNYNTGNGLWNTRTVRHILSNKSYLGVMEQGKDKILVENTHEAIVSKEIFERVQNNINSVKPHKNNTQTATDNIFKGKIICGDCGGKMQRCKRTNKHNSYYYFVCINNRIGTGVCGGMYVKESDIVAAVKSQINNFLSDNDSKYDALLPDRKNINTNINKLKEQMINIKDNRKCDYEAYIQGQMTKEQYMAKKKELIELESSISNLENQIAIIDAKIDMITIIKQSSLSLIVSRYIDKIAVYKDKNIEVRFFEQ